MKKHCDNNTEDENYEEFINKGSKNYEEGSRKKEKRKGK